MVHTLVLTKLQSSDHSSFLFGHTLRGVWGLGSTAALVLCKVLYIQNLSEEGETVIIFSTSKV